MAKYSEQWKLKLVKEHQAGAGGVRMIAQRHGVGYSVLRRWIAVYEQHGREGLRKKYSHYDAHFRMSVLSHMWREELSYQQAAAVFDIRAHSAIAKWERQYCVFRTKVTGRFGIVTDDFGNVTGRFGNVTERTGQQDWRCA